MGSFDGRTAARLTSALRDAGFVAPEAVVFSSGQIELDLGSSNEADRLAEIIEKGAQS